VPFVVAYFTVAAPALPPLRATLTVSDALPLGTL
jgi:hypothetical protein